MMNEKEISNLAQSYMKHYRFTYDDSFKDDTYHDQYFWARVNLDKMIDDNPDECLLVIFELIRISENDKELAFIAAGPLEDMFCRHGRKFITKIEKVADNDRQIQFALSGVWLEKNEDAYQEWFRLMKKYKFVGNNPREAL